LIDSYQSNPSPEKPSSKFLLTSNRPEKPKDPISINFFFSFVDIKNPILEKPKYPGPYEKLIP
jgi:hypothetical protein